MTKEPAAGRFKVPFRSGSPVSWAFAGELGIEWRDNFAFAATLTYVDFERGRSAAHLIFRDEDDVYYAMFLIDFDAIMRTGGFDGNKIGGIWTFSKRGQNFGVRRVGQCSETSSQGCESAMSAIPSIPKARKEPPSN